jgi:glycosyltransferase involved in cell wall biosynthesis
VTPETILSVHNFYQQPGGEDFLYKSETALLEQQGHSVVRYEDHNDRIHNGLITGLSSIWNHRTHRRIGVLAQQDKPAVAHFYNTFPLISPSAYYAVKRQGIAVVQKLSNYRLVCPGATLLRDGKVCEECIDQDSLLPSLRHRCYRGSLTATASVAAMLSMHRLAGTWTSAVDLYIAPTDFSRQKFIEGGLPADRVVVKPYMLLPDPGVGDPHEGSYALFVGRLSEEKGIHTLLASWTTLSDIPLKIMGDGPLVREHWPQAVTWLGQRSRDQMHNYIRNARVLIVPSTWYEIGPLTILEAFACGTPVIASNLGSMAELVRDGHTGLLFRPGDPVDLAEKVRYAFTHPEHLAAMRINARREYEEKYTAERNYKMLIAIYEQAIENAQRRKRAAS